MPADSLNMVTLLTGLLGGLALFLLGMQQLTGAMKAVAGRGMKKLLSRVTGTPIRGALTGIVVTGAVQSSSVTTVLIVGFISAGLMTLHQSIGIILGANIGSTFTAQIIAFKVTDWALGMIAAGFALHSLARRNWLSQYGLLVLGLGMLFLGMGAMSDATRPLRTYEPFLNTMASMANPVWGIAVGAIFTAIVQSSGATTGIVIVLAGQGVVSLDAGIALILGANIGTCATAMLATIGKSRAALQAAVAHVLFNLIGAIAWVAFIPSLGEIATAVSPAAPHLEGMDRLAAEAPRQLANAHTIFNVINMLVVLPFTHPYARLVERLVPERAPAANGIVRPKYLGEEFLHAPDVALENVRRELAHMGEYALRMIHEAPRAVLSAKEQPLESLEALDDNVDTLHGAILPYLSRLAQQSLTTTQSLELQRLVGMANELETLGDLIETNLVTIGREIIQEEITVSPGTQEVLAPLIDRVLWATEETVAALEAGDAKRAAQVIEAKEDVRILVNQARGRILKRLGAREPNRVPTYRVETELIETYRRLFQSARRIAKGVNRLHTNGKTIGSD